MSIEKTIYLVLLLMIGIVFLLQSWNYFFSKGGIKNRYCQHGIHIMSFLIIIACSLVPLMAFLNAP